MNGIVRVCGWMAALALLGAVSIAAAPAQQVDGNTRRLLNGLEQQINAHEGLSPAARAYTIERLLPAAVNPAFVSSTAAQNSEGTPLSDIKEIDAQWSGAEEPLAIMDEKLGNACADALRDFARENPELVEVFVMDDQGAVVCENNLTSDYWQGDEAKWQNSYNDGQGGVDAGEIEFDRSANAQLQQVSLPVIADGGRVIGAITFGVDVGRL